jgi:hypothetical protein
LNYFIPSDFLTDLSDEFDDSSLTLFLFEENLASLKDSFELSLISSCLIGADIFNLFLLFVIY